ncbi:hypothetical protein ACW7GZ_14470 [Luteimonas sp. A537]
MTERAKSLVGLGILLAAFVGGAVVFRDSLGLVIFLLLGLAVLAQIIRVALSNGDGRTLGTLWRALKDAFWGIG